MRWGSWRPTAAAGGCAGSSRGRPGAARGHPRDLLVRLAELAVSSGPWTVCRTASASGASAAAGASVVVDHVELVRALVAGQHLADLRQRSTDPRARRGLEDERHETSPSSASHPKRSDHVVARLDQPYRKQRDDPLDAAVAGRRHGEPHRREDRDLHSGLHLGHAALQPHVPDALEGAHAGEADRARPRGDVLRRDRLDAAAAPVRVQAEEYLRHSTGVPAAQAAVGRRSDTRPGTASWRVQPGEDLGQLSSRTCRRIEQREH